MPTPNETRNAPSSPRATNPLLAAVLTTLAACASAPEHDLKPLDLRPDSPTPATAPENPGVVTQGQEKAPAKGTPVDAPASRQAPGGPVDAPATAKDKETAKPAEAAKADPRDEEIRLLRELVALEKQKAEAAQQALAAKNAAAEPPTSGGRPTLGERSQGRANSGAPASADPSNAWLSAEISRQRGEAPATEPQVPATQGAPAAAPQVQEPQQPRTLKAELQWQREQAARARGAQQDRAIELREAREGAAHRLNVNRAERDAEAADRRKDSQLYGQDVQQRIRDRNLAQRDAASEADHARIMPIVDEEADLRARERAAKNAVREINADESVQQAVERAEAAEARRRIERSRRFWDNPFGAGSRR